MVLYPQTSIRQSLCRVNNSLEKQYEHHRRGRACRTTALDPPIVLVYSEEYETFSEARKREAQVKRWSRAKKEALVLGDLPSLRNLSKSK